MQTDRREFLRLTLGSAVTMGAVGGIGSLTQPARAVEAGCRRIPKNSIGMHLYTMRSLMSGDAEGTLEALANIGYRRVGVSGKYGYTPDQFRALLNRTGMRAVITHRNLSDIHPDAIQPTIDDALALGVNHIVVRSLPVDQTPDAYKQAAELFNQAGEVTRRHGLGLLFHNHAGNFAVVDGVRLYDVLLQETDPRLVGFEFDIYWAVKGGVNIVRMWEKNPRRFPVLHVKDMAPDGDFADVGSGVIDFAHLFDSYQQAGVKQWLVEHDNPSDPLSTARNSYEYLLNLRF